MNADHLPASVRGWRRLWRPDRPAFWMAVLFNCLSSVAVLAHHALGLQGLLMWLVLVVALINSLLGMWWLGRLWRDAGASSRARPGG